MAHYAFIDENNIVVQIIVGRDESEVVDGITDWESHYSKSFGQKCLRTSFSGSIRKNFAGIGYIYDENRDAFIPPKPHNSWILNEDTCLWEAPTPYPNDGGIYKWDEEEMSWTPAE